MHGPLPAQLFCPFGSSSAFGAGRPAHVLPPSVVCTMDVHGFVLHGAVPSSQPSFALTNVKSWATKPFGTGAPLGLFPAFMPAEPGDSADVPDAVPGPLGPLGPLWAQPASTRAESSAIAGLYPIKSSFAHAVKPVAPGSTTWSVPARRPP